MLVCKKHNINKRAGKPTLLLFQSVYIFILSQNLRKIKKITQKKGCFPGVQPSIWQPRKLAATCASLVSASPRAAPPSGCRTTTAPVTSLSAMIGYTIDAGRLTPSTGHRRLAPLLTKLWRDCIYSSSSGETRRSRYSRRGTPAAATT